MDKFEEVKKQLDAPVICEDGKHHHIDENHKRYLASQICRLFEETMDNPYPSTIEDECSGQVLVHDQHRAWEEGHKAGIREVGEWLERMYIQHAKLSVYTDRLLNLSLEDIKAFKRGKMPPIRGGDAK